MEALTFGIPVLSFPDMKHSEQESNADVVDSEGYGRRLAYSTPPEQILSSIRELIEDKKIHQKVGSMKEMSEDLNAASAIKNLLESNSSISKLKV